MMAEKYVTNVGRNIKMSIKQTDVDVENFVKDITTDTILIEVQGGHVTEVHNDSNGYMLFDWDSIGEQDSVEFHKKVLKRLLETKDE